VVERAIRTTATRERQGSRSPCAHCPRQRPGGQGGL
jgi:hypothetical protein